MSIEPALVPGQVLLEKYRVERLIGRGGMGLVFAARHLELDEAVAIKVLLREVAQYPQALARLRREARILARVRNEHVVQVFDLGQLEDGAPYMIMEHLAGRDLASVLQDEGRFGVEKAVDFVLQALVALAVAHQNGIVHRDLKPENLFCTTRPDGSALIKVLDFGISRLERLAEGSAGTPMTHSGTMIGTPLYMSPEQLRSPRDVDTRSDIWALGIVLYEFLTGVLPFSGVAIGDVAVKIALEPPHALRDVGAALPAELEQVLLRCLQKDREKRFANVAELARALAPFAPKGSAELVERIARIAEGRPSPASDSEDAAAAPGSERLAAPRRGSERPSADVESERRRRRLLTLLGALLLGTGALSWLWTSRGSVMRSSEPSSRPSGPSNVTSAASAKLAALAPASPSIAERAEMPADSAPEQSKATPPRRESQPSVKPSAAPLTNGRCSPPYTVDLQGRKRFKHECFTAPR